MDHPATEVLLEPELPPEVAAHVARCATCRAERALFADLFGEDSSIPPRTWVPDGEVPPVMAARFVDLVDLGEGRRAARDTHLGRPVELLVRCEASALPTGVPGLQAVLEGGDPVVLEPLEGSPLDDERFPTGSLTRLAAVLAILHGRGHCYGDLTLDDVRQRADGQLVLRMPTPAAPGPARGVAALSRAPELRQGGRSQAGDAYAFGQLVRTLAVQCPDTPAPIEALWRDLVDPDPDARPDDAEVLARLTLLPEPGSTRYPVLGSLGSGGMGEVVRVVDPLLRREVALKRLHPLLNQRHEQRQRFVAEAQTIAQLQHPGIVPVFERGLTGDGSPYYTMPVVQGRTLTQVIAEFRGAISEHRWPERRSLSLHRLVSMLRQAAEAVGYAHSRGVIHRDLKPDNVMVGEFGEVWVMDWGLSRASGEVGPLGSAVQTVRSAESMVTRHGTITGTPAYMSPEHAAGEPTVARTDVYALGTVLYELLCGELPYGDALYTLGFGAITAGPPPPLADRLTPGHPPVPDGLVEICQRAMAWRAEDRFADGRDLAQALGDWLEGAQRRELARDVVDEALEILEEAELSRSEGEVLWAKASVAGPDEVWALLERSRASLAEAEAFEHTAREKLQGALIHEPTLPEAHRALAAGYRALRDRFLEARSPQRAAETDARLRAHLEALPAADPLRVEVEAADALRARVQLPERLGAGLCGRRALLDELSAWSTGEGRLLSLVGTAGAGKTRLATHFARRSCSVQGRFCDVSSARSSEDIVQVLASVLGLSLARKPVEQVGHALRGHGPMVLVLDNLEQVAPAAAGLLERWLAMAPELRVVATSRVKLGLSAEQVVEIAPLGPLAAAEMFESLGRASRPGFRLGERSLPVVLQIVGELDHLPLAIELAAARLGALGLDGIQSWLADRFALLRGGLRDPTARALEGALEASWSLLSTKEQAALAACSVCRGGWDLAAASAVIGVEEPDALDLLDALVEDHLVVRRVNQERPRYSLLESVAVFARSKLGEEPAPATRHARHFAGLARAWRVAAAREQAKHVQHLAPERFNLRRAVEADDPEAAAECAYAMAELIARSGPLESGVALLEDFLERPGVSAVMQLELRRRLGGLFALSGSPDKAHTVLTETLAQARELGETDIEAGILANMGRVLSELGQLEGAVALYDEVLARHETVGVSPAHRAMALHYRGDVRRQRGDLDRAQADFEQALEVARSEGDDLRVATTLGSLGMLLQDRGEFTRALEAYEEASSLQRKQGHHVREGVLLAYVGLLHSSLGAYERALEVYAEALAIHRQTGNRLFEASVLNGLGGAYISMKHWGRALEPLLEGLVIYRELGNRIYEGWALGNLGLAYRGQGRRDEAYDALQQAMVIGDETQGLLAGGVRRILGELRMEDGDLQAARSLLVRGEEQVRGCSETELLEMLCALGSLDLQQGDPDAATGRLAECDAIIARTGLPQTAEAYESTERLRALLGG